MSRGAGQILGWVIEIFGCKKGGEVKYFYVRGGSYEFKKTNSNIAHRANDQRTLTKYPSKS